TTKLLANGQVGSSYSQTVSETDSQGSVSYVISSGSLPHGVTLNANTGTLSGTPTISGSYSFTIEVSDNNGSVGTYTDSHSYTVSIAPRTIRSLLRTLGTSQSSTPLLPIDISNLTAFEDGSGYTLNNLQVNSVVNYTLPAINSSNVSGNRATESHSITINSINLSDPSNPSVTLTLRSSTIVVTLYLYKPITEDVNGDGIADIGLEATSITASGVNLKVWKLVTTNPIAPDSSTPPASTVSPSTSMLSYWIWYLLAVLIALVLVRVIIKRRHATSITT
ncbi:MAG TPA: putative Ig domain-containing protein, partial [Candidatus Saccharimonadales bacterium]